jgi:hypothetical protein
MPTLGRLRHENRNSSQHASVISRKSSPRKMGIVTDGSVAHADVADMQNDSRTYS